MTLAARLVAINVFLLPLFAYQNRQFFMPGSMVRDIECQLLTFVSPLCWIELGKFLCNWQALWD